MRTRGRAARPSVSVLFLTTTHQPFDVRIFHKLACSLAHKGYRVFLAAPVERTMSSDGVTILPLGACRRSRFARIWLNLRALRLLLRSDQAVIQIHDPEMLITAGGFALFGRRVIYDIHEFYADRLADSDWIRPSLRLIMSRMYLAFERLLLPHFAGIIVVTEEMQARYTRYAPHTPVILVRNYPALTFEMYERALAQEAPLMEPYIIHTGGASRLKAFDVLVAVAERLSANGSPVRIVNLGPIDLSAYSSSEAEALLRRAEHANVVLPGTVSYQELLRWIAHARFGYLLYTEHQAYQRALPTKLFEYFVFGRPVVASRVGLTAQLVEESQAGLTVSPTNVDDHMAAIERLLSDEELVKRLSEASYAQAANYRFEPELQRFLSLYERLAPLPQTTLSR